MAAHIGHTAEDLDVPCSVMTCLVNPSTEVNVCPKPFSHKGHAYETFVPAPLFVEFCVEVAAATAADFFLSSSLLFASSTALAAASRNSLCASHLATCSRCSLNLNDVLHGHVFTINAHNFSSHRSSTLNLRDNGENFSRHTGHGVIVFVGNFDAHRCKHASQNECTRHPANTGLSFGCLYAALVERDRRKTKRKTVTEKKTKAEKDYRIGSPVLRSFPLRSRITSVFVIIIVYLSENFLSYHHRGEEEEEERRERRNPPKSKPFCLKKKFSNRFLCKFQEKREREKVGVSPLRAN